MKPILILDNYDSFTYNIAHIVKEFGYEVEIYRNDKIALDEVAQYDKIILSPGGGIPSEAGILMPLIERYASSKSILGICLGEQAIGEVFGAKLTNLDKVFHGIESRAVVVAPDPIFEGLGESFTVGRYHSWVVSKDEFPAELEVTAEDSDSLQIMALRHRKFDVRGIQFHPESVLTPVGKQIIEKWLKL